MTVLVDTGAILALADEGDPFHERHRIRKVMTLDHQHFDAYRPSHCTAWEHLIARD